MSIKIDGLGLTTWEEYLKEPVHGATTLLGNRVEWVIGNGSVIQHAICSHMVQPEISNPPPPPPKEWMIEVYNNAIMVLKEVAQLDKSDKNRQMWINMILDTMIEAKQNLQKFLTHEASQS